MCQESTNLDLEQFTEQTAEQVIFIVGATTGDSKAAVMGALRHYLELAQEQTAPSWMDRGQRLRASIQDKDV